ncbi:MAG: hypothetical protein JXX29_20230 [Deltaproteobacteria bacterium]|nr:hypothetical protein [Deltaproteobacteria bacterium]MBN2674021.1 hypothetical protein [Deltaproteobacteria bacterium]
MRPKIILILLMALTGVLLAQGCGPDENPIENTDDNDADADTDSDGDSDADSDADGDSDSDTTNNPPDCEVDAYETFDTAVPTGWTVISTIGGNSGSTSGSGTDSDTTDDSDVEVDPAKTWHHTTVTDESNPHDGMEEGYMTVGGYIGMYETLQTDIYPLQGCETVTLAFTHYFDDYGAALGKTDDRGELWFIGDTPPWTLVDTYADNEDKAAKHEEIDLSSYTLGQSTFQLRFIFADESQGNYGWSIDNVSITAE